MTPTPKLRFVERKVYVSKPAYNTYGDRGEVSELVKKTILQQWWDNDIPGWKAPGEWRDVPMEVEA
jgi:hypothetical protein